MHECTLTDVLMKWSKDTTEVFYICGCSSLSSSKQIHTLQVLKSNHLLSTLFLCFTIQLTQCNILCKHQVSWVTRLPPESNMSGLSVAVSRLCRVIEALKPPWGCTVVTFWGHLYIGVFFGWEGVFLFIKFSFAIFVHTLTKLFIILK